MTMHELFVILTGVIKLLITGFSFFICYEFQASQMKQYRITTKDEAFQAIFGMAVLPGVWTFVEWVAYTLMQSGELPRWMPLEFFLANLVFSATATVRHWGKGTQSPPEPSGPIH